MNDIRQTSMSIRTVNCLWRNGLRTVEQLQAFVSERGTGDLMAMRNFGAKSLAEVEAFLADQTSVTDQPAPTRGKEPVWPYVIQDLMQRVTAGRQRYGTELQTYNGRDALVDAYQEALDLCLYLRQAILERDHE